VRRSWLLLGVILLACSGGRGNRSEAPSKRSHALASSGREKTIAPKGGVIDVSGAQVTIPAGAVNREDTYSIALVAGADLAGWPQGTSFGFVFEPAGQHFRIPVLIELPNDGVRSEAMCETSTGERIQLPPDAAEEDRYRFHVTELPARCAIYAPEHTAALEAARERQGAVVAKQNGRHKWEIQSELCNPNLFLRPNAGRSLEEVAGVGGCLPGMVPIPGARACVDRWEAHVVEVLEDGTVRSWSPFFNPGGIKVRARSSPGAFPQSYISQVQAAQACSEAGKRLCTDTEWVAACRGSKKSQFPYGDAEKPTACNDRRDRHPAIEYLESTDVFARLEHPCINQVPDTVMLTGAKSECSTPEGVFDMVGNLHEWTADPNGTFRGGYYVDAKLNGRGCDYVTTRHDTIYWDYSIGFRCCADHKAQESPEGSATIRVSPE
jgi:hypothetical protein